MPLTAINLPADQAPMPLGAYSHAVRAGDFIYLCGLGARSPETGREVGVTLDADGTVAHYDIAVQTRQVLANLETVLAAAGCTLQDVVDVTVFLAHMADFAQYNAIYAETFCFPNPPARTTMEARPPGYNFIEIKAIAYKPV
jgi:2-aminomuconate deaminase